MVKKSKSDKRKAKVKAKKQQAIQNERSLSARIAIALEKLCEPVMPEYIDDSKGFDLTGRRIVWQMGLIAWNIAVTGRNEIGEAAIGRMNLSLEEQKIVKREIDGLVRKKIEMYPAIRTAIIDISIERSGNKANMKVELGDTVPAMPVPDFESPAHSEQKTITQ